MGDVLNTREMVSVQSLSAATRFFDELSQIAPVHVILGYFFSLSYLRPFFSFFFLYFEWEQKKIVLDCTFPLSLFFSLFRFFAFSIFRFSIFRFLAFSLFSFFAFSLFRFFAFSLFSFFAFSLFAFSLFAFSLFAFSLFCFSAFLLVFFFFFFFYWPHAT